MKEYKVVYWEDLVPEFCRTVVPEFEKKINILSKEGWTVRFSQIEVIPKVAQSPVMAAFALLEQETQS